MLDEDEFLSDHGIRSYVHDVFHDTSLPELIHSSRLSKKHKDQPWGMDVNGERYEVNYWPGDSKSGMFGGNSNWRGPICKSRTCPLLSSLTRESKGWPSTSSLSRACNASTSSMVMKSRHALTLTMTLPTDADNASIDRMSDG